MGYFPIQTSPPLTTLIILQWLLEFLPNQTPPAPNLPDSPIMAGGLPIETPHLPPLVGLPFSSKQPLPHPPSITLLVTAGLSELPELSGLSGLPGLSGGGEGGGGDKYAFYYWDDLWLIITVFLVFFQIKLTIGNLFGQNMQR